MVYVNCPECGHRLMESDECSNVRVKCCKCNTLIVICINNNEMRIKIQNEDRQVSGEKTTLKRMRNDAKSG